MQKYNAVPNRSQALPPYIIVLSVLGLASLSIYLFAFMHQQTDTDSYLNAVDIFLGKDADPDKSHRIVKIINYLIPASLYQVGIPIRYGFFTQQWLSYAFSAYFAFQLFLSLGFSSRGAFYGMFAYLSTQCVAIFNFALMTDGMGWMMELWGLWLSTLLLNKLSLKAKVPLSNTLSLGLVFGLGLLIKESVLMAGLYLFIGILMSPNSIWEKLLLYVQIGAVFLMLVLGISIYTEWQYGKSMLSWWKFAHTDPRTYTQPFKIYLIQLARTFDLHWFWIIIGGGIYLSQFKRIGTTLKSMFLAAVIGLIIFPLAWPYLTDRIIFMIPILLLPMLIRAVEQQPLAPALLVLGGLLNLWMTYRIYYAQEAGWLLGIASVFTLLLVLSYGGYYYWSWRKGR